MKLNIGCGDNKLEGYVNIDIDESLKPDLVCDVTYGLPYEEGEVEEVLLYHTIEHLPKFQHQIIYQEVHRVLKPDGLFIMSFPEFLTCVENWKNNVRGNRQFWEATIYGRQASKSDYHVCIMDLEVTARELTRYGFEIIYKGAEPLETWNSVIKAKKCVPFTYEQALKETVWK